MQFRSIEEILDFAIGKEMEAHDMYRDIAAKVKRPGLEKTFLELAEMELGHKAKLEAVKAGDLSGFAAGEVQNLKISDHLVDVKPHPNMDYQEALLFAMKAEQRAHDLYVDLARATSDPGLREVFKGLAKEELKHKLFFETEYDDVILEGN